MEIMDWIIKYVILNSVYSFGLVIGICLFILGGLQYLEYSRYESRPQENLYTYSIEMGSGLVIALIFYKLINF